MERVLVTGGAGFIGSNLVDSLLAEGKQVICADNFNSYYDPKAKERNIASALKHENFSLRKVDVTDFEAIKDVFKKFEIEKVVHLAAQVGVRNSINKPLLYQETNVKGTINMLELAREFEVKNFVFASSSSVYGAKEKGPFLESSTCQNPVSPYAASKKSSELFAFAYSHLYKIPTIALRFFTVYGPRQRPDMAIHKFTNLIDKGEEIELYGDGQSMRDYTFVDDVVGGISKAIDSSFPFEVFNLGNSKPVTLTKLIGIIEEKLGKKAKIKKVPSKAGDVSLTFADISKAKKLLGYNPKVPLEEGIAQFVNWFKSKG